jgi:hypothetical protein
MQQKYIDYIPNVLLVFQHIEEAIRQYLLRCEYIIATRLEGIAKYRISEKQIDKFSLGRLVDEFERFNDNDDLIRRLRSIVAERNFIAHQSYIVLHEKGGKLEEIEEIKPLYERAVKAKESAEKCFFELIQEIEKLEERFTEIQRKSTEPIGPADGR